MKKAIIIGLLSLFLVPAFAIDIGEYKYYERDDLGMNLKKILREYNKKAERTGNSKPLKIKVVDELVKVWKVQKIDGGWARFDTKYFRCIVQRSSSGSDGKGRPKGYRLVREINNYKKKLNSAKEIKSTLKGAEWKHYGLVTMYATVIRSNKWGKVSSGKRDGVRPEQIILQVEAIHVPRDRYIKLYKKKR